MSGLLVLRGSCAGKQTLLLLPTIGNVDLSHKRQVVHVTQCRRKSPLLTACRLPGVVGTTSSIASPYLLCEKHTSLLRNIHPATCAHHINIAQPRSPLQPQHEKHTSSHEPHGEKPHAPHDAHHGKHAPPRDDLEARHTVAATHPVHDLVPGKDMEWRSTKLDFSRLPKWYMELSKVRLTGLVVVTSMAGYAMAPGAFSAMTLALVASGTLLTSSAANAINQWLEVPYDAQMARTAARPLVRRHVSPLHAVTFASVCGASGIGLLYLASPLAAALGAFNLALYTSVYTPMKRITIANTWVGAVVGGIPPLIGWAAATGSLAPGAWLLAALLYAWQFPHFNALSWNLRKDYARAGYRIMAVTHPDLTRRVALRYSLLLAALPFVTSCCDVTTWMYAVDSLPVNAYLVYLATRFYREKDSASARALTRFSYLQLTAGIILMLLAKRHYSTHTEPESTQQHGVVAMETQRGSLRDWCIGEPLIQRGWNLNPLFMLAETEERNSGEEMVAKNSDVNSEYGDEEHGEDSSGVKSSSRT